MNFKIDIEVTPAELRKLLGLPDVEAFQREIMGDLRKRMLEGVDGYDPIKLFQPYLTGTLASWEMLQKVISNAGKGEKKTDPADSKK
jgi:hypothetical protein